MLAFAGNQTPIHPTRTEAQDVQGATPAVQYGKGTGMTRNQTAPANANRVQTAQDSGKVRTDADPATTPVRDSAYRK
jgi:hypothetical protein